MGRLLTPTLNVNTDGPGVYYLGGVVFSTVILFTWVLLVPATDVHVVIRQVNMFVDFLTLFLSGQLPLLMGKPL